MRHVNESAKIIQKNTKRATIFAPLFYSTQYEYLIVKNILLSQNTLTVYYVFLTVRFENVDSAVFEDFANFSRDVII